MTENVPQISILLSVKNGMPYLPLTLESLIRQSFRDWELIVVDNASSDDSVAQVEAFASQNEGIRLIKNERDLGHSGGLNRGLAECRGEWTARMDADDIALPNRLERQLAFVKDHPKVAVASCLAYYIDAQGKRLGKTHHDLTTSEKFAEYMRKNEAIGILHPGALMKTEVIRQLGGYRPDFDPANDIDLWSRVAETGAEILVQPEYLMEYRVHPQSIVTQSFMRARMKYEWARVCMTSRRAGQPEPSWEEFLAQWNQAPWPKRVNRWRKIKAKSLYRKAGFEYMQGQLLAAALDFGLSSLMQPEYALNRLKNQLYVSEKRPNKI